jgi:hypothetical protein
MFRHARFDFNLGLIVLAAALLAHPWGVAQRGGGGGHVGGGTAGGGGLSNVGKATGVDDRDGLKDFRAAMAVQATSQQVLAYAAMMKSTEVASAELKKFVLQLGKENGIADLASQTAALERAIEQARTENKKFLDGFSDPQKSGLKEISKRLIKADSDLGQQAKAFDLEAVNSKTIGQPITASAQTLDRALTSFQTQQVGLGEEMGIGDGKSGVDFAFNLGPLKRSINVASQPVAIITSEVISNGVASGGQSTFKFQLTADLSDLQQNITDVLHSQLDQAERCGESIAVQTATFRPLEPASVVVVQLHFERWTCRGREANEMVEGTAVFEVKLTLSVGDDGALRLTPEIGRVDAQGLIGEWLRAGSPGESLRDKINDSILSALLQSSDFNATLPPSARGAAMLHGARFQGSGSGKLWVVLGGEIRVSNDQAATLTSELRASELKADESKTPELKRQSSAPEAVQETVPR